MTLEAKTSENLFTDIGRHPKSINPSSQYLLGIGIEFSETQRLYYFD